MNEKYYKLHRKYANSYFEFTEQELRELYRYMTDGMIRDSRIDVICDYYKKEGIISVDCPCKFMEEINIPCPSLNCKDCWRTAVGWYRDKNNYWRID